MKESSAWPGPKGWQVRQEKARLSFYQSSIFSWGKVVEARKLKDVTDLLQSPEERVELINGKIVRRPMARFEHGAIQSGLIEEVSPLKRKSGSGGWWIVTEVSVRYSEHECPSHDLAGWRKERLPRPPSGVVELIPDWVCEITSPGHEGKDLFHHFLMLQRYQVPYYWVISPEERTLIAYQLKEEGYGVVFSVQMDGEEADLGRAEIPPFEANPIDLGYVFDAC
jgi:Uma2 family endonuclease